MKKILMTLASAVVGICAISGSASAQTHDSGNYNLQRAYEVLKSDNDEDQALSLLQDQLHSTPDNAEAYLLRARIFINRKEYGNALSDINQALKYNKPKKSGIMTSSLHWWKAVIYERMDDFSKAAESYRTALDFAKKDKRDNVQDISFAYGQALYDLKDYDGSDAVYNQMLREDETDVAAMVGLARNLIKREEYGKAVDLMERAEKLSPEYGQIYRFRMQAHDKLGETDEAIDDGILWFDKDSDCDADDIVDVMAKHKTYALAKVKAKMKGSDKVASWHALNVMLYEKCCDYDLAIKEYNILEEEFGKDESIYIHRGDCYCELGLTDLAISEINKALEMSDGVYNRASRADVLRKAARYEEAMADYQAVIDKLPDNAYGYYALGWCYELQGNDDKAMETYTTGIDLDRTYPYIFLMRGELYLKQGAQEKANADFNKILQIDTLAESGSCRMYALHFLGKDEEALEWMQKIIDANPYDAGEMYNKACLLSRMGKLDESVEALGKAFEMGYCGFEHIRHDDDMDAVRDRDDFKALMDKYEAVLRERVEKMGLEKSVEASEETITEVPISRHSGGTFDVACQVNGLGLNMIFDTGASDVSISKVEADFMFKNNYIAKDDIKGKKYYQTADGGISEGTIVTLKEVKIGDAVLHNVDASVVKSQKAPLLLGESVLQKFGTFTVDNINSKLIIKH